MHCAQARRPRPHRQRSSSSVLPPHLPPVPHPLSRLSNATRHLLPRRRLSGAGRLSLGTLPRRRPRPGHPRHRHPRRGGPRSQRRPRPAVGPRHFRPSPVLEEDPRARGHRCCRRRCGGSGGTDYGLRLPPLRPAHSRGPLVLVARRGAGGGAAGPLLPDECPPQDSFREPRPRLRVGVC